MASNCVFASRGSTLTSVVPKSVKLASLARSCPLAPNPKPRLSATFDKAHSLRPAEPLLATGSHLSLRGVRTSAAAVDSSEQATEKTLRELTIDDFDTCLEENEGLVVVDFYTDWCGPCKIMLPMLVAMQDEMPDVLFTKLNCNKKNKELGMRLSIKVAPTFLLFRGGQKVAGMTGAKIDELRKLIEAHR